MRFEVINDTLFVYDSAGQVLEKHPRQPVERWTRVMGYHRPVASFNIGKQGEHKERRFFRESAAMKRLAA